METPKRKLSCRLQLRRCTQPGIACKLIPGIRTCGGPSGNWLRRVRSAEVVRFFEHHVVELEKKLHIGDRRGFLQSIKSVQLEETNEVESEYIRDEDGRLLRYKGRNHEGWVRFVRSLLNMKSNMHDPDITSRLRSNPSEVPSGPVTIGRSRTENSQQRLPYPHPNDHRNPPECRRDKF